MEPVREDKGAAPAPQADVGEGLGDYLVFEIEDARYALPVASVHEVLPALEVDVLPGAGEDLLGVITLRGRMVPVLDTRKRLGADARAVDVHDHFVVAEASGRLIVLPCDRVQGIASLARNEDAEAEDLVRAGGRIARVVRDADGLVLVPDLTGALPEADAA